METRRLQRCVLFFTFIDWSAVSNRLWQKCESLLLAESLIKCWAKTDLKSEDVDVVNEIYSWVSLKILPSPEYAGVYEEAYVADGE